MSSRQESDFVYLEQLLREADKQAEQEQRYTQEAEQKAEIERQYTEDKQQSRKEAEQRAELEQQYTEDKEKKTKHTIFEEYIHTCYILFSKPLRVQTDKSFSIQGSITSLKNKPYLTLLKL
jgi:hypothetical protein